MRRNLFLRFSSLLVLLFFVGVATVSAQSAISTQEAISIFDVKLSKSLEDVTNYEHVQHPVLGALEVQFKYKATYHYHQALVNNNGTPAVLLDNLDDSFENLRADYDPEATMDVSQLSVIKQDLRNALTGQL